MSGSHGVLLESSMTMVGDVQENDRAGIELEAKDLVGAFSLMPGGAAVLRHDVRMDCRGVKDERNAILGGSRWGR